MFPDVFSCSMGNLIYRSTTWLATVHLEQEGILLAAKCLCVSLQNVGGYVGERGGRWYINSWMQHHHVRLVRNCLRVKLIS
ncbi:Uncharacterized protein APZ42_026837 [Daphnia magna]|uniref:Uncharacterized protein n=1 Tax=Daphnia magna TaxID=35525 RepID=A0A162DAH0_9CRUS|nr:Uncharacterized protein APZ42_026837 [Daphnia magna]